MLYSILLTRSLSKCFMNEAVNLKINSISAVMTASSCLANYEKNTLRISTEILLVGLILIFTISCTTNGYRGAW